MPAHFTLRAVPRRLPGGHLGDERGRLADAAAEALAAQDADAALKIRFAPIAKALTENEVKIVAELLAVQGHAVDIGGYYRPDAEKMASALRPSATLNAVLAVV
mgnify:CR=1 FL=1